MNVLVLLLLVRLLLYLYATVMVCITIYSTWLCFCAWIMVTLVMIWWGGVGGRFLWLYEKSLLMRNLFFTIMSSIVGQAYLQCDYGTSWLVQIVLPSLQRRRLNSCLLGVQSTFHWHDSRSWNNLRQTFQIAKFFLAVVIYTICMLSLIRWKLQSFILMENIMLQILNTF